MMVSCVRSVLTELARRALNGGTSLGFAAHVAAAFLLLSLLPDNHRLWQFV